MCNECGFEHDEPENSLMTVSQVTDSEHGLCNTPADCTTCTPYATYWEALDRAPSYVEHTAALLRWSGNYEYEDKGNPLPVFLDLIGWSDDHYGETVPRSAGPLAAMELDYLGDALKEYASRPQDVSDWLNVVMFLDM